ncbi:phage major capsid protein [Tropicimonas marinistellae]|uniref:phage major capsid protein n=1 Tax=Tropicimonas marinistellae TaxID=1739787 RepID=UPI0008352689|nr:phage major capsid protein [Tropicimonas marinistellae]
MTIQFTDRSGELAIQRHCQALLRDMGTRKPHSLEVHRMQWQELNRLENRVSTTARDLMKRINDNTPQDEAESIERAFDALMDIHDALAGEKDYRMELDSKEPRAAGGDPRRPLLNGMAPGVDEPRAGTEHTAAFTNWLRAPLSARAGATLTDAESRAGTTLTGPAGGYVVPSLIADPLMSRARASNPFRGIIRVAEVASADVSFPLSNSDATSGWVGETDTRSATTEPTLASKVPTFGTCYSYVSLTEELASDAMLDIGDWFAEEAGKALGEAELTAIVSGDGDDKPTGLLDTAPESGADGSRTADAFKYIASGVAADIEADNLLTAIYDLKADYRANGRWLMNSVTAGVVRKLKDGEGRYMWTDSLSMGQPATLAGYPVTIAESMPDIGANAHPLAFGDWRRAYVLATRGGLSVTVDANITTPGYIKLYIRHRIGGCVYDENAARFIKCATS